MAAFSSAFAVAVFGQFDLWLGLAAAIVGILFWIVGLFFLNWIFERYLKDIDQPDKQS